MAGTALTAIVAKNDRPAVDVPDPRTMLLAGVRSMKLGFEAMAATVRAAGADYTQDVEGFSAQLKEIEDRCRSEAETNSGLKKSGEGFRLLLGSGAKVPAGAIELGEKVAQEMEAAGRLGGYFSKLADDLKKVRTELEQVQTEDRDTVLQMLEDMSRLYDVFEGMLSSSID
jgi:hypothetical protein